MNGAFERDGRNPITGALVLVLGLGSIYFLVQSLLLNGYIFFDLLVRNREVGLSPYETYQGLILAVLAVTQYVCFILLPWLVISRWHTPRVAEYLRLDQVPVAGVLVAVVGVLAILPPAELLARLLYSLLPELQELTAGAGSLVRAESPGELVAILFVVAVTPALCEELLFRAYLQRTLERRMRAPWHFILSGVLFGLFHQQVLTLPSLLLVGVYLSYIYWVFGSPWVTAAAHFAYNGVQILLINSELDAPLLWSDVGFAPAAVVGGVAVTGLVVIISLRLRTGGYSAGER